MIILIYVSFVPVRVLHEDEKILGRKHIYLPHAQTVIYYSKVKLTRIILRPLSALSLDEGLNSPCDKNASAALWKREPISDDYLSSMRKAVLSISGNIYKQQELEIDKLIYDV